MRPDTFAESVTEQARKRMSGERAITVFAAATRNIAFQRNAIVLAIRLPEAPTENQNT